MFKINKMDFLVGLYICCLITSEFIGSKIFPIISVGTLKLNASVGIFLIPLIYSINDVVVEVYGPERARSIVRTGLFMLIFIAVFSTFAVMLPAAKRFQSTEPAYELIFSKAIRITLASLTAFGVADFLDIYIFSKLRESMGKKALWLRNNVSNFVSELFDTVLFYSLAFYALDKSFTDNFVFLCGLILPYWLLKCSMSVIETPFVYVGVKWLKDKKE